MKAQGPQCPPLEMEVLINGVDVKVRCICESVSC